MNYRALVSLGSLAAIALGAAPVARAADAIPAELCRQIKTPAGGGLNLRSLPSVRGTTLGAIANGQRVQFNGSRIGPWVTVAGTTSDGQQRTGWVWEGYLEACKTATSQQPAQPTQPTQPTNDLCRTVTYRDGLSVHEIADFTSRRLGSVPRNSRVRLQSATTTTVGPVIWGQISEPIAGWVAVRPVSGDRSNLAPCK